MTDSVHVCLYDSWGNFEFVQPEERDLRYSVRNSDLRAPHREKQGEYKVSSGQVYRRKGIAVSRGRGIMVPARPVTMQKVFPVLALIAFACDTSRILVHGDSVRKPEAAERNGGYEYQVTARSICFCRWTLRTWQRKCDVLSSKQDVMCIEEFPIKIEDSNGKNHWKISQKADFKINLPYIILCSISITK